MATKRTTQHADIPAPVMDVLVHGWGGEFTWAPRTPGWVAAGQMSEADFVAVWRTHREAIRAEALRRVLQAPWAECFDAPDDDSEAPTP